MTINTEHVHSKRDSIVHLLIGILVFGSIWGFMEATLGGFLNMIIFPNKGAIMGAIGTSIMALALGIYKKPSMLPGIGIVAASFKLLNVWLLFVPISTVNVINPAMAIILESLAFSLAVVLLNKQIEKNAFLGIGAGAVAGILSSVAYVYFSIYIMHAPLFKRLGITSIGQYVSNQGLIQAAFFAVFVPLGYLLGKKLAARASSMVARRAVYYGTAAATVCAAWSLSAIAVAAGL